MKKLLKYFIISMLFLTINGNSLYAQTYKMDLSFGDDGRFILPSTLLGDWGTCTSIAFQSDGKIIAGGFATATATSTNPTAFIVRLLPNGEVDTSFQNDGILILSWTRIYDLMVTNDDNIYFCGEQIFSGGEIGGLVGFLYPTLTRTTFGHYPSAFYQIGQLPSNDIICAGYYTPDTVQTAYIVALQPSDLSFDNAFGGSDGHLDGHDGLPSNYMEGRSVFNGMDVAANGKIVAVGAHYSTGDNTADVFYSRWNADGTPDVSFSSGIFNIATWNYGNNEAKSDGVQLDNLGNLCIAGYRNGSSNVMGTAEWLDHDFNGSNNDYCYVSKNYCVFKSVVHHDGGMIYGGQAGNDQNHCQVIISRHVSQTEIDTMFGNDGTCTYFIPKAPGSLHEELNDLAVDNDQNIYAVGASVINGESRPVIVKLIKNLPNSIPSPDKNADALKVVPNPASNQIKIGNKKIVFISIYDLMGRKVFQKAILPNQSIDIDKLPSGIYQLMLNGIPNAQTRFIKR